MPDLMILLPLLSSEERFKRIYALLDTGQLRVYDADRVRQTSEEFDFGSDTYSALSYNKKKFYVIGGSYQRVYVFDLDGNRLTTDPLDNLLLGTGAFQGLQVTDNRVFAVRSNDATMFVWDKSGNRLSSEDVDLSTFTLLNALFVTKTRIYTTNNGTNIHVLDRQGTRLTNEDITNNQVNYQNRSIAVSPDRIMAGLNNGQIRFWTHDGTYQSSERIDISGAKITGLTVNGQ